MENFGLRELPAEEIDRAIQAMDRDGYAKIAKFFPDEMVDEARQFVNGELDRHAREYFSYIGREPVRESVLADIGASANFRNLLARDYAKGTGKRPPEKGVYQVLRVLSGRTGLKEAFQFHYDAYVVTALMPIAIPSGAGEKRGDLVIFRSCAGVRSNVVVNLVEKVLLQNRFARKIARAPLTQRLLKAKTLRMEPGDLYLFWGYQSLHGNEPCFPTSTRATALFHLPIRTSTVSSSPPSNAGAAGTSARSASGRWRERARAHEAADGRPHRPPSLRTGFGGSSFWAKPVFPETAALTLVETAIAQGITFFDTGASYAAGNAERRLGSCSGTTARTARPWSSPRRERTSRPMAASTRIGRARRCAAASASLERLGLTRIDILHLHGPTLSDLTPDLVDVEEMRRDGLVRFIGINSFDEEVLRAGLRIPNFDSFMLEYNVLKKGNAALIDDIAGAGRAVLVGTPVAQALFTGQLFDVTKTRNVWALMRAASITANSEFVPLPLPQPGSRHDRTAGGARLGAAPSAGRDGDLRDDAIGSSRAEPRRRRLALPPETITEIERRADA